MNARNQDKASTNIHYLRNEKIKKGEKEETKWKKRVLINSNLDYLEEEAKEET